MGEERMGEERVEDERAGLLRLGEAGPLVLDDTFLGGLLFFANAFFLPETLDRVLGTIFLGPSSGPKGLGGRPPLASRPSAHMVCW